MTLSQKGKNHRHQVKITLISYESALAREGGVPGKPMHSQDRLREQARSHSGGRGFLKVNGRFRQGPCKCRCETGDRQ